MRFHKLLELVSFVVVSFAAHRLLFGLLGGGLLRWSMACAILASVGYGLVLLLRPRVIGVQQGRLYVVAMLSAVAVAGVNVGWALLVLKTAFKMITEIINPMLIALAAGTMVNSAVMVLCFVTRYLKHPVPNVHCGYCGYVTRVVRVPRCPECGQSIPHRGV